MCTLFSVKLRIRFKPKKIALRRKISIRTVHFGASPCRGLRRPYGAASKIKLTHARQNEAYASTPRAISYELELTQTVYKYSWDCTIIRLRSSIILYQKLSFFSLKPTRIDYRQFLLSSHTNLTITHYAEQPYNSEVLKSSVSGSKIITCLVSEKECEINILAYLISLSVVARA